jgi:hypothetical protein
MAIASELLVVSVLHAVDGAFEAAPEFEGEGVAVRALRSIHKSPKVLILLQQKIRNRPDQS